VRIFEAGKSFHGTLAEPVEVPRVAGLVLGPAFPEHWGSERRSADFFDIKSDIEALLALTGAAGEFAFEEAQHTVLQPGQAAQIVRNGAPVGVAGKLHPAAAQTLNIDQDVFLFELDTARAFAARVPVAQPVSKFPAIRRDIALVVAEQVTAAELVQVALSAAPDIIRRAVVFDVYRGPGIEAGLKSVALGLILQETYRTLTDEDADSAMHAAVRKLQQEFAAVLRE
jgi:phenylalanyl-tRNA synthetase beta chain